MLDEEDEDVVRAPVHNRGAAWVAAYHESNDPAAIGGRRGMIDRANAGNKPTTEAEFREWASVFGFDTAGMIAAVKAWASAYFWHPPE